ncbi:MAG: response regulator [Bacteroidota bacterium]
MNKRILLIDDDQTYCEQLPYILREQQYEVQSTTDPKQCLSMISTFHPDVLLLDWEMPVLSGIEICRTLRQVIKNEETYVIMISGRIMSEDIVAALSSGANDYIIKPFSTEELIARILVGMRHADRAAATRVKEELMLEKIKQLDGLMKHLPELNTSIEESNVMLKESNQLMQELKKLLRSQHADEEHFNSIMSKYGIIRN